MTNKIIKPKELLELEQLPQFVPSVFPNINIICAYCRNDKNTVVSDEPRELCKTCGASLLEGYRFVGMILDGKNERLFIKDMEAPELPLLLVL